jgi:alpha/beta superfamily hydrolase
MVGQGDRQKEMKQQAITFPCGQITLHGYCFIPDKGDAFPGVIICHPHSLYGGSMSNTVVVELASMLADRDIVSMIFNFRGVGKSQGEFGGGITEQEDVVAAINWLETQPFIDRDKIGLAGYSFGAGVLIPVACRDIRVKTMALISPVLDDSNIPSLLECNKPKFFIVGEYDDVTPSLIAERVYESMPEPKQYILIPDADHFWNGYVKEVIEKTADYLIEILISK